MGTNGEHHRPFSTSNRNSPCHEAMSTKRNHLYSQPAIRITPQEYDDCRVISKRCHCAKCKVCGHPKHSGIHLPPMSAPESEPIGHRFQP